METTEDVREAIVEVLYLSWNGTEWLKHDKIDDFRWTKDKSTVRSRQNQVSVR